MTVVKVSAFLLVETISRNHIESGGSLASCGQKLFSPKNVPDPFLLLKLKGNGGRGKGITRTTEHQSLKSNPAFSLFCLKQEKHSQIPQLRLPVIKL